MTRTIFVLILTSLMMSSTLGCGGCDDSDDSGGSDAAGGDVADVGSDVGDTSDSGDAGDSSDHLDSEQTDSTDVTSDGVDGSDADSSDTASLDAEDTVGDAGPDSGQDASSAVCGDGTVDGAEACDDGNTDDGDYCSADCSQVTGSCGDGTVQSNESCDDGASTDCTGTHDGGDGTCVPQGECSSGYVVDSSGDCVENSTGLSTPCQNGSGWTLFRFHYDSGSTSPRIDVWDATCNYSYGNQACNVQEVTSGFYDISRTSDGYPIVTTSSEWIRARFSVSGLSFTSAAVHIQGRSYSTFAPTDARVESPLYGARTTGPIDQDFTYDWYALDWTGYLQPTDDPGLTAIEIFADGGSGELAVQAVELCVE